MNRSVRRIASFILVFILFLSGLPSEIKSYAAPANIILSVAPKGDSRYEVSYPASEEPGRTEVRYHRPDGTDDGELVILTDQHTFANGRVSFTLEFLPDHIYDIQVDAYKNAGDPTPSHQGSIYYLADITFTGESFNQMAKMSDIEDNNPYLEPNTVGSAVIVKSGDNPVIRFKWKIPKFYSTTTGKLEYLTTTNSLVLDELEEEGIDISKVCFQISMTVGHGSTKQIFFNTDNYNDGTTTHMYVDYDGDGVLDLNDPLDPNDEDDRDVLVSGISSGTVTSPDNFVSVVLQKEQGIEPGTEYEFTNIGIIFENAASEQVPIRRSKLNTDSDNRFLVKNIDNVFSDLGIELTSIYTPMQMELTKVDTDKVQVRFRKITNGVYPELFYQVQHASRIDDFFSQNNKWVKIPAYSLPSSDPYGSEIVTITLTNNTHPEYYFRVVYYDSSSALPRSSSLAINLQLLGVETGKPPLPKEIKAEPIYAGRGIVTVPDTELSSGNIEIPLSDLKLSFEKPLAWKSLDWNTFKASAYQDEDYTFHILLSAYLPGSSVNVQTKKIGSSPQKEIYLPVKQKRVLVLGKKDFIEDPNDTNRIICTIPGNKLFFDYVGNTNINNENNEDPSEDGMAGDYPTFLVPNTTYYMQIFTSRLEDNDEIYNYLWGDGEEPEEAELYSRLSFTSPIVSFTTWPLTETPVPMPDIKLGIAPETVIVDPSTGEMRLDGITATYERVLTDTEWQRYTSETENRVLLYEFFLSRNPSDNFRLVARDEAKYPDEAEIIQRSKTIKNAGTLISENPDVYSPNEPILPNTVYYIKARASLVVDGEVIGRSDETAVKAITTPKIDNGGIDNTTREPRSPSEFSIAVDSEGQLILSDASVTFNWLHAESDVTYELICTTTAIDPQAEAEDYEDDPNNIALLGAYGDIDGDGDNQLDLNVNDSALRDSLNMTLNSENGAVTLPISRFLRPNRTYFFSLRAVRTTTDSSGNTVETRSRWITVPVTTRMVKAPAFIEAVTDLEIGFNVPCAYTGATSDSFEVYLKKAGAADSEYVKLTRGQYTSVLDNREDILYIRVYNLESAQWYDVRIKNRMDNSWYNSENKSWRSSPGSPVRAKTRDALKEIEVRFEGEGEIGELYTYHLEARTDGDADYEELNYRSSGFTDYGYDLESGRVSFYIEKTNLYVQENSPKYIYYAKISGKPVRDSDGDVEDLPLKSNTLYYVKLWAHNQDDSLHIGPVTARTDFSQADYDDGKKHDNVIDLFENEADTLTRKLYWRVDIKKGTSFRAILKDTQIAGLLQAAAESTVTVDLSTEQPDATFYEILVPYKTLEAIENTGSRLNLKFLGSEITLNKGSIDLAALRSQALVSGAKEAMLLIRLERKQSPKTPLPSGLKALSRVHDIQLLAVGSRLTYAEISDIIYNILKNPNASGPFSYGILDRELTLVLRDLDNYSYKSHTDLKDLIKGVMVKVETELSRYLKDVIDGGSGLKPDFVVSKAITSFPGRIGVKLEYTYQTGIAIPYVNDFSGSGWKEVSGSKAYVMQVVLFRADRPGEYAVIGKGAVSTVPGSPFEVTLSKFSEYDLTKAFGTGTIYPENPVTGQQAVMLYAVMTRRDQEVTGMTPAQKVTRLGLGDVIGVKQLTGYMDNQTSLSLSVKLYCSKANINPSLMKPSKNILIANGSQIEARLYPYVLLGIDLDLARLENKNFDATGRTTTGTLLDMISKVLEKFNK